VVVFLLSMGLAASGCGGGSVAADTQVAAAPRPASGAAPSPLPADPADRIVPAGLTPERKETLIHHVHSHLDVFVNGKAAVVPARGRNRHH